MNFVRARKVGQKLFFTSFCCRCFSSSSCAAAIAAAFVVAAPLLSAEDEPFEGDALLFVFVGLKALDGAS